MKSTEMRAVRALFSEPQKALFSTATEYDEPDAPVLPDTDPEPKSSEWFDLDDFVEVDWAPSDTDPRIWLVPCADLPRFTFLKRDPHTDSVRHSSKFGAEDTHNCLQGREDCT